MHKFLFAIKTGDLLYRYYDMGHNIENVGIWPDNKPRQNPYPKSTWESLCSRCGECCFYRYYDENMRIKSTGIPCPHLNVETMLCNVYPNRMNTFEGCSEMGPYDMPEGMPEGCTVVKFLEST